MSNNKLVSIIIVTWNTGEITRNNILALQKYLPNNFAEIIVIDNASTDNTSQLVSTIPNIIYLRNETNLGFSKANNIASNKATSDHLFFMNSDMEIVDSSLVSMLDFYNKHSDCGLVGPQFLNTDLSIQSSVFPPQTPVNAFKEYWLGVKSYSKYHPDTIDPIKVWAISGGAVLVSRQIFDKVGGWNEKFFMYYEDLELCKQIRKLKKEIYYFPKTKIIHKHGASGTKLADPKNQWKLLIPSSILYHGKLTHYTIYFIIKLSQICSKIF